MWPSRASSALSPLRAVRLPAMKDEIPAPADAPTSTREGPSAAPTPRETVDMAAVLETTGGRTTLPVVLAPVLLTAGTGEETPVLSELTLVLAGAAVDTAMAPEEADAANGGVASRASACAGG